LVISASTRIARLLALAASLSMTFHRFASVPQPVDDSIPHSKNGYVLHPDLISETVKKAQYAVRGELYLRAVELENAGMEITYTNSALSCLCSSQLTGWINTAEWSVPDVGRVAESHHSTRQQCMNWFSYLEQCSVSSQTFASLLIFTVQLFVTLEFILL
jgi:hypothetical protein